MTAKPDLILYSRPGCHLCEQAADLLDGKGVDWREVNIDEDRELEQEYGLIIPVVYSERAKKKLFYPFGAEQLGRFLKEIDQ